MNDDFSADATTPATYTVSGSPLEARFEESGDVDWIRVKGLQKFFFYDVWLFRSTDEDFISYADLSLYNSSSRLIWEPQHSEKVPGREDYQDFGDNHDHFHCVSQGNDYHSYQGHNNDVINKASGGGTETLRIEGPKNFDGLEDLQFRRFGNNLKITLEFDNRDRNADSIVIKDMGTRDSAVERLALIREGNLLGAVSLQSVWHRRTSSLEDSNWGRAVTISVAS